MYADGFDYRTAARLHQDRLDEAESNRQIIAAKKAAKATAKARQLYEKDVTEKLRQKIGRQLIALGEKMSA